MARIRTVKIDFYKDEALHSLCEATSYHHRDLFQGLWLLADRKGRLEDRPKYIKSEIFPYDDGLNVDPMLTNLMQHGFIARYQVGGKRYIQVKNFLKHQRPNKREAHSDIPPCPELDDEKNQQKEIVHMQAFKDTSMHVQDQEEGKGKEGKENTRAPKGALTPLAVLWNSICVNSPKVLEASLQRRKKEQLRLVKHPEMSWWSKLFEKIKQTPFCLGQNDRGWKATFDWIIENEENALKVLEGKYDGNSGSNFTPRNTPKAQRNAQAIDDLEADWFGPKSSRRG